MTSRPLRWLYINYDRNDTVCFYDLLADPRVYGSNESERELSDDADVRDWRKHFDQANKFEKHEFDHRALFGARYYPVL